MRPLSQDAVDFCISDYVKNHTRIPNGFSHSYDTYKRNAIMAGAYVLDDDSWANIVSRTDLDREIALGLDRVMAPYRAKIQASYRRRFPWMRVK